MITVHEYHEPQSFSNGARLRPQLGGLYRVEHHGTRRVFKTYEEAYLHARSL